MEILHWFEPHANGCNLRFDRELARQQKKALKIISRNDVNLYYKSKMENFIFIILFNI